MNLVHHHVLQLLIVDRTKEYVTHQRFPAPQQCCCQAGFYTSLNGAVNYYYYHDTHLVASFLGKPAPDIGKNQPEFK